jgi:ketosteroid isomerase-like protein
MRRALPLVLLLACKTNKEPPPAPVPSASVAAPIAVDAGFTPEQEAAGVVKTWNDALDKHDVAALEKVYADNVVFYALGSKPKASVIAMKKSALGPKSTFHQQIVDKIEVTKTDKGFEAAFTKRSGNGTKLGDTKALLVLAGSRGELRITEERDYPRPKESCEDVASLVAWGIPEVKKAMDDVRAELKKHPDRTEGGLGPMTMEDGTIVASLGVHSPERFETIASYTVYPNGRLDVTSGAKWFTTDPSGQSFDSDPATKLSEADRKRVTAACSHSHTDEHGEGAGHGGH